MAYVYEGQLSVSMLISFSVVKPPFFGVSTNDRFLTMLIVHLMRLQHGNTCSCSHTMTSETWNVATHCSTIHALIVASLAFKVGIVGRLIEWICSLRHSAALMSVERWPPQRVYSTRGERVWYTVGLVVAKVGRQYTLC